MDISQIETIMGKCKISDWGLLPPSEFENYMKTINEHHEEYNFEYRDFNKFIDAGKTSSWVKTIIIVIVNYFSDSDYCDGMLKLSNYSRSCWNTIGSKIAPLLELLKNLNYNASFLDISARATACKAGLGFIGKNTMFYSYKSNSFVGIATIGVDFEVPVDNVKDECVKNPLCMNCNKCINACPVNAILPTGYHINPLKCISFLNRHAGEYRKIMPSDNSKLDNWLCGCEVCQDVCPLNKNKKNTGAVISKEINLYGMTIPNKGSIPEELVKKKITEISSPGYKDYLLALLN